MKIFKVGIAGYGIVGKRRHQFINEHTQLQVIAVCDQSFSNGYEKKDKRTISKNYLIPKIIEQVNFKSEDIIIPDDTIDYIVENYTEGEKGVRNLKRSLEIIYTKLNLYRLMKPDSKLFEQEMTLKVEFPYTVTSDIVKKLIKKDEKSNTVYGLYV